MRNPSGEQQTDDGGGADHDDNGSQSGRREPPPVAGAELSTKDGGDGDDRRRPPVNVRGKDEVKRGDAVDETGEDVLERVVRCRSCARATPRMASNMIPCAAPK